MIMPLDYLSRQLLNEDFKNGLDHNLREQI